MGKAIFIFGPQGCGKSTYAPDLMRYFNKKVALDYVPGTPLGNYPEQAIVFSDIENPGFIPFEVAMHAARVADPMIQHWREEWFQGHLSLKYQTTTVQEAYRSYVAFAEKNGGAITTLTKFGALLGQHEHVERRRSGKKVCTFVVVEQEGTSPTASATPARLVKTYGLMDLNTLDDCLCSLMSTIEDGLITAGFTPGSDYTRRDLLNAAIPLLQKPWTEQGLTIVTSYPAFTNDND